MSTIPPSAAPMKPIEGLIDPSVLVYRIDIFLLIVVLVFAAFNAPRAVARIAHRSEWLQGHILRAVTLTGKPRINLNTQSIYLHSDLQRALDLDGGSTEAMHMQNTLYFPSRWTDDEKTPPPRSVTIVTSTSTQQTWHMPMLSSLMHPVANLLQKRVNVNYSLGQVLLLAGYTIVILFAVLYQSIPFIDPDRSGLVTASQLPFIYIFATKNNVIGMLVGIGYEKLNYLHRYAGFFAVIVANIHAIGHVYGWFYGGTLLIEISRPSNTWGFIALTCLSTLSAFSLQSFRSRFYGFFLASHVVALIALLFAVYHHSPECVPYVIVACAFYGLDHLVRAIKTRVAAAVLRPIPELGLTRVEIPTINAGWRAGQHVRLRILSTAMGFWGMTEVHPFTIASVSKTEEGLVLLCKKTGKWTGRMYELASTSTYGEQGQEVGKSIKVMVEGPYGGVGSTVIRSYSGALFIVGGGGVTFGLSTVQDLVRSGSSSNVTDIHLVWCIANPASLTPMVPLFSTLISQSTTARLRISIFYTRAPTNSFGGMYLPPGIALAPGRPKFTKHLGDAVNATLGDGGCNGVFVGVCGPASLAASISDTVRRLDPNLKRAVGGVEYHEEVFGW